MVDYFAINNIDKIMVDDVEWKCTNKITLRKVNRNLILEFHNEVLTDDMAKKMELLYRDALPFTIKITYKKHYADGKIKEEVKTLYCTVPNDLLLESIPGEIINLNLKAEFH